MDTSAIVSKIILHTAEVLAILYYAPKVRELYGPLFRRLFKKTY